jgi:hypothetical protein
MPPLSGDEGDTTHGDPTTWFSLTATQYRKLARWKEGDFVNDWPADGQPTPLPLDRLGVAEQPAALTRASLEACQGGAFFPGIEMTSIARFASLYGEAFRVGPDLGPGDVTRWMALPWQADFYECRDHWWPAGRPDDVVTAEEYERLLGEFQAEAGEGNLASLLVARRPWARGLGLTIPARPGLPDPGDRAFAGADAAAYHAAAARQLGRFVAGFLRVLPQPLDGEVGGLYHRRLEEFLAGTVVTPGGLQLKPPEQGEAPADYAAAAADLAASRPAWQGLFDVEWRRRVRHQGKNDLAGDVVGRVEGKWGRLGFVVPRTAFGETALVESDRGRYDLLSFRDSFYYLMNLESHEDFLPAARRLAEEYLQLARDQEPGLRADPATEEYGYFDYDPLTFQARLEKIYERQRSAAAAYNPATGEGEPLFRTPAQLVERIRQLAPFNQLDGSWLERAAHAGPIDEVQSALFEIWSDEIGNGNPAQSHANVYGDLLHSAGIYLPPLTSRVYADNPDIWESSVSSPAYQTAIAHFPEDYFHELLGMTLYLEWEAVFLPAMVKLYEYHGYSALFYRLHVAIDNPVNGHGSKARDAVIRYLDQVRSEAGEAEVQAQWRRVWTGYLAFKFVGGDEWLYRFTNPPTPEQRVLGLIERKRHYAQLNHGERRLGPNYINDWFDEPGDFLNELVESDLITKGDPAASRLFALMAFTGPMLKVFSAEDKEALAAWIGSLPPDPVGGALGPGEAMLVLVRKLRPRAAGVPEHQGPRLKGKFVDPARPGVEVEVTQPVAWWFQVRQPQRFMAALADRANGWVVPGSVADSRLVTELLSQPRRTARFLTFTVPELGGKTARQVIVEWIAAGCPIPAEALPRHALAVPAAASVRAAVRHEDRALADEYAREVEAQTRHAVPVGDERRRGALRRRYGPGGGAPH